MNRVALIKIMTLTIPASAEHPNQSLSDIGCMNNIPTYPHAQVYQDIHPRGGLVGVECSELAGWTGNTLVLILFRTGDTINLY